MLARLGACGAATWLVALQLLRQPARRRLARCMAPDNTGGQRQDVGATMPGRWHGSGRLVYKAPDPGRVIQNKQKSRGH